MAVASTICVESFSTVSTTCSTRVSLVSPVFGIDHAADVVLGAIAGLGRLLDGVLHGLDDDLAIDRLLARDRIGDLHQLQTVSANSSLGHLRHPPIQLMRNIICRFVGLLTFSLRAPQQFANKVVRQHSRASAISPTGSP